MRKLFFTLLGALCILIFAGLLTVYLLTDSKPLVTESGLQGLDEAESVTALLQQLQRSVSERSRAHTIPISQAQADSLMAFIERAKPQIVGAVTITQASTELRLSVRFSLLGWERFANLQLHVLPGGGLQLERATVGSITLPGDWALGLVTGVVDYWTASDIATYAVEQIRHVTMTKDSIVVELAPLEGLLRELTNIQNGLNVDQDEWLSERTAYYLRFLARYSVNNLTVYNDPRPSLAPYIQAVITYTMQAPQRSAAEENEAALLALAVFAGHHRFGNLVGQVQVDPDKAVRPPHPVLLAQRQDLNQHFILSAGIKLLSEQGITHAIGEFKELMDRVLGGSGFSFVDLAADMAGVEFAAAAIDPARAEQLQQYIANGITESDFFPLINDLPEGLDKPTFTQQYSSVESAAYQLQVEKIRARITRLPLFQALAESQKQAQ
ncbi:hypothetical protein [Alteromonas flava]|uniref:hypothetical protein n=1 Tax=Alteromonas flava TaxID=2048003 RepID=UPI000C28865E|nr:hypothetical protein [Alteromonas flava]